MIMENKQNLQKHFTNVHWLRTRGTQSTKQQRVMEALWTWDEVTAVASMVTGQMYTVATPNYLTRSAAQMRAHMIESHGWVRVREDNSPRCATKAGAHIDDNLAILLD